MARNKNTNTSKTPKTSNKCETGTIMYWMKKQGYGLINLHDGQTIYYKDHNIHDESHLEIGDKVKLKVATLKHIKKNKKDGNKLTVKEQSISIINKKCIHTKRLCQN